MVADAVDAVALARPRIRVQRAVKSFSGRVVVDVDDLVLGEGRRRGEGGQQQGEGERGECSLEHGHLLKRE